MTKDQHQTAQPTNSGTSGKSSAKNRVQIPEKDFAAPVAGVKGSVPNPSIDIKSIEMAAKDILEKQTDKDNASIEAQGEAEFQASLEVPAIKQAVLENDISKAELLKMIQDLQRRNGGVSSIESAWADAASQGKKDWELDEQDYAILTRQYKEKPSSVVYKNVRFFKKGTMQDVLDDDNTSVDYRRGMSKQKFAVNRFKGRG